MKRNDIIIFVLIILTVLAVSKDIYAEEGEWLIKDKYFETVADLRQMVINAGDRTRPLSPYSDEASKWQCTIPDLQRYQLITLIIDMADGAFLQIRPKTVTGSEYEYEFAITKITEPKKIMDGRHYMLREGEIYHFKLTDSSTEEIEGTKMEVTTALGLKSKGMMRVGYHVPAGLYLLAIQRRWVRSWTSLKPSDSVSVKLTISVTEGADIKER